MLSALPLHEQESENPLHTHLQVENHQQVEHHRVVVVAGNVVLLQEIPENRVQRTEPCNALRVADKIREARVHLFFKTDVQFYPRVYMLTSYQTRAVFFEFLKNFLILRRNSNCTEYPR